MNKDLNILYWYGHCVTEKDKAQLTDIIDTVYIDLQNYDTCAPFLLNKGFKQVLEGEELTGHNDLYQYKFKR